MLAAVVFLCLSGWPAYGAHQQPLDGSDSLCPRLNFSSPSPLIFHSTFALLQQWPNTYFPNGHTIAPCTIAKNTNLYHARTDTDFPPSPEWFAFDADMAYPIAGLLDTSRMLTFRTTRDVKCLYFDGTSASLMDDGSMDAQMLLIHNNSDHVPDHPAFGRPPPKDGYDDRHPPANGSYDTPSCPPESGYEPHNRTRWNPLKAEYDRASGLCNFIKHNQLGGLGWGFEGIVRMNAAFEVIWCNFTSPSARLVSWLNVSAPPLDGQEARWPPAHSYGPAEVGAHGLPTEHPRIAAASQHGRRNPFAHPFISYAIYEWFHAAAKRYGFVGGVPGRGEARVKIESCSLFSFYDSALSDQEQARVQQERLEYNLSRQGVWHGPETGTSRSDALQQLLRRRRVQRIANVSESDGSYVQAAVVERLRGVLEQDHESCSGVDWVLICQEMVTTYTNALHDLSGMLLGLANVTNSDYGALRDRVAYVRDVAHGVWMPYYEYPDSTIVNMDQAFSVSAPESEDALERCKTQYRPYAPEAMSQSEQVTYTAISEVLTAICGTLLPLFLDNEKVWLTYFNNASAPPQDSSSPVYYEVQQASRSSLRRLEELKAWLGWADQWTACSPGCGLGQICHIPIWPLMGWSQPRRTPGNHTETRYPPPRFGMDELEKYLWEPQCVDAEHYPPY